MRIFVVGILIGPGITIRIFGGTDENSGMTVRRFAGTSGNSGETGGHTGGEKSRKTDGNYGMIGGSCGGTHRNINMSDIRGGKRIESKPQTLPLRRRPDSNRWTEVLQTKNRL